MATEQPSDDGIPIAAAVASAHRLWRHIVDGRRLLVAPLAMAIALGLAIAYSIRSEFSSSTRILPYRSAPASTSIAGLAGLAGIRLPGVGSDQTITADLYPILARTVDFRIAVAETPVRFFADSTAVTSIRWLKDHRTAPARVGVAVGRAIGAISRALSTAPPNDTTVVVGALGDTLRRFDREYADLLEEFEERLVVSYDKKSSVITISSAMPSAIAATDVVEVAADRLMKRIIDFEAHKAAEQLRFIEEQYHRVEGTYRQAQRNLAEFTDRNRTLVGPLAQIERDRLQRDFNIAFEVFQQVSLELERARLKKNEDTPVFATIESAVVPIRRSSPNRPLMLLVAMALGLAAGVVRIELRRRPIDA